LNNQTSEFIIGTAGDLFLLWMGWGMSKNPVGSAIPIIDKSGAESNHGPISAGIILSASNPCFLCGGLQWVSVSLKNPENLEQLVLLLFIPVAYLLT